MRKYIEIHSWSAFRPEYKGSKMQELMTQIIQTEIPPKVTQIMNQIKHDLISRGQDVDEGSENWRLIEEAVTGSMVTGMTLFFIEATKRDLFK